MRRTRASVTAWPAFADFMTILAVVSLAIAAGVLADGSGSNGIEECRAEKSKLKEQNAKLRAENSKLAKENEKLRGELGHANGRIAELQEQIRSLESRKHFGHMPCLPHPSSPTTPVPLLEIVVNSGYILTGAWGQGHEGAVADVPRLRDAIAHGQMDREDFERYADEIYRFGDEEGTFKSSCRFFVKLRNETDSLASFARGLGVVSRYFLISNSSEVNGILRGPGGTRGRLEPR